VAEDDTVHVHRVEHNLDDYAKLLDDINNKWDIHNRKVKAANAELSKFRQMEENVRSKRSKKKPKDSEEESIIDEVSGFKKPTDIKPPGWTSARKPSSEELFPEGKRYRSTDPLNKGTFVKRPEWSQPKDSGPTGQFKAERVKPGTQSEQQQQSLWKKISLLWMQQDLKRIPVAMKYYKEFTNFTSGIMSGSIGRAALGLSEIAGPVGLAAGAIGGTVGAVGMGAQDFRERQARAQAYGLSTYQQAAFANISTEYLGGEAGTAGLFGEVVRQKTTIAQPSLFGKFLDKYAGGGYNVEKDNTETLAEGMLLAERKIATDKNISPQMWDTRAAIYGLNFDRDAMMRMRERGTTEEEMKKEFAEGRKNAQPFIDEKGAKDIGEAGKAWTNWLLTITKEWDWIKAKLAAPYIGIPKEPGGLPKSQSESTIKNLLVPFYKMNKWIDDLFGIGSAKADELPPGVKPPINGNVPSKEATPEEMETAGSGDFVIPGDQFTANVKKTSDNMDSLSDSVRSLKDFMDDLSKGQAIKAGDVGYIGGPGSIYHAGGMEGSEGQSIVPSVRTGIDSGGGGGGGKDDGSAAAGAGIGGAAPKMSISKKKVAAIVADKFRKAGASEEGIAGMMANIADEGQFNPGSRHFDQPKFRGTEAENAHGLWQMGGGEWNHYAAWIAKNHPGANWADPEMQSDYQIENLKKNYPKLWSEMTSHTPAGQQATDFVSGYEHPAASYLEQRRAKYSRGVAPVSSYTGGETPDTTDIDKVAGKPASKSGGAAYPPPNISAKPAQTSMNDMNLYQGVNKGQDIQIFNKSGGNVIMQSASIGLAPGNFNT
jgi:hypothetical protein